MMRALTVCFCLFACSHGLRKDTPPLEDDTLTVLAGQGGLTKSEAMEHLLSRTTFGARPADRQRVERIGAAAWLEEQLHPERIDDSTLSHRLATFEVLQRGSGELVRNLVAQRSERKRDAMLPSAPDGELEQSPLPMASKRDFIGQLAKAKLLRAVASERQLQEVMVDFWFNHFNVFAGKQEEAALLPAYEEDVLRRNALGHFGELLEATARSPAMLIYLDNWRSSAARRNRKGGINENYARELLELHTLGVDGGYTQQDVVEVARCFTGWTVENPKTDPRFIFRAGMHDFGRKVVLGHVIAAGQGVADGEQVLHILLEHPSTARFIARKLARRFVSDDPAPALVDRVAAVYTRTGGDVRSMLRALFESPELWSRAALKAKVRSPLEFVAAAVRGLDASVDDPTLLVKAVARIGEPLYAAQAPTGYPDVAQAWLSSGALLARIDFGLRLANDRLEGVHADLSHLAAGGADDVLEKTSAQLGATALSVNTRTQILAQLRAQPVPARAAGLLLGAPEWQRR